MRSESFQDFAERKETSEAREARNPNSEARNKHELRNPEARNGHDAGFKGCDAPLLPAVV
jgi:hypothetical protein